MRIKSLKIENFRNIKNIEIFPNDEMNVIYGENAQGKTNILEAIWLFTGAKSFRGAKDEELKKFGSEKAKIFLEFEAESIEKSAQIEIKDKR
ncbi:MAG: AAA family ATPase, partial [Acutalibacteraceae bacterium]|nr:AAA family ATPase [Acutalibacteraceae bacterium]